MRGVGPVAALLLAAVGPPVAVAGIWRDALTNHPVLAAVLVVGYEILLAVLFLVGKIATELSDRWLKRIVNWLDQQLLQRFSRFDKRYREFVLDGLRFIDLKGLGIVGPHPLELDEVFVDVSLAFREPRQASGSLLAALPPEVTDRHSIWDFLDRQERVILAVTGAPGSGKTTLLRHTARQLCRSRRGPVPILLYLRDHASMIASKPSVALPDLVRDTLDRYRTNEPDGWFEKRLNDGDCLVLLDGLDEVARPKDRRDVASWVERQITQYSMNDFVITSRPHGYETARIDGATALQVRSFTDEQVTRFIQNWYLAVERHSTGMTGEDVSLLAKSKADDLLQRLNDAPALYDLTINPLLLTMIANVHHYRGTLPGNRVHLYREICEAMLWGRQEAKKLPITPDGHKKQNLLCGLAFTMMQRQVWDLPRADVLAEIVPALGRISRKLNAEEFLIDVEANGLLIERENGVYSFAHQTFQEYLAAAHIHDKGLVNVLAEAVDNVWWRETTLLYTAWSDADPIVRACLDSASVTALLLAFDCAGQGPELAPELRDSLDHLLASAFTSDPERRRLIANVLLTRHLRHLIRTGNGGRVCASPITTILYKLYRQDTECPASERPVLPDADMQELITGVHRNDAVPFVHWVNGITASDTVYRLPSLGEMNDSALHRVFTTSTPGTPSHSVWLEPENEHDQPELWIPAGTDHPHLINADILGSHVKTDVSRSTPTLIRLLLLRSAITVDALTRNLGLDLDLTLVRDLDLDLDLARNLDLTLVRTRAHDPDLAIDLDSARNLTRDLAYNLTRTRNLAHTPNLIVHLARTLDSVLARDLARTRNLAHTLDLGRPRSGIDPGALHPIRDATLEDLRARIMGSALAGALNRAPRDRPTLWTGKFVDEFANETGIAKVHYVVSFDTLADKVHSGQQALVNLLGSPDGAASRAWARQVASNLRETALPILTGQQPLSTDTATALRFAAFCLAAEADIRKANQLGDTFREIAAGVTLLERRTTGQAVPTETIMLAIS